MVGSGSCGGELGNGMVDLKPAAAIVHVLQAVLLQKISGLTTAITTGTAEDQWFCHTAELLHPVRHFL